MINIRKLEAQYDYLLNLPDDISAAGLVNKDGQPMTSLGEVVNNAMQLIEDQSEQLTGVLPISYTDFSDDLSLVKMIVNIIEPKSGILLDPACGSGGMFIQSGDFVNQSGRNANSAMTFYV